MKEQEAKDFIKFLDTDDKLKISLRRGDADNFELRIINYTTQEYIRIMIPQTEEE